MSDRKPLFSLSKDDLEMQTFSAGGPGGQNQNKTQSGVRFVHPESGLAAESRVHKEQLHNKRAAFRKLAVKVVEWWRRKTAVAKLPRNEEVVRTYHAVDNRVTDKASGLQLPYKQVLNDPTAMIEARRDAKLEE